MSVEAGRTLFCAHAAAAVMNFCRLADDFRYVNLAGESLTLTLPPDSMGFTVCQTPVVYKRGDFAQVEVVFKDGRPVVFSGNCLDVKMTQHIFNRDGQIKQVNVTLPK